MNVISKGIVIGFLIILTGCATPLTKQDLASIKTVGVMNNFPDQVNFTSIGTTVFNNEYDQINEPSLKALVASEVISQISSKGYSVKEIASEEEGSSFDLIMTIIPRDIYNMIGTYGFGFYERSFFGIKATETSYVALNLSPVTKGVDRCDMCYGMSLSDLPIDDLPAKWADLDSSQQQAFITILKQDIKKAVKLAFDETGL